MKKYFTMLLVIFLLAGSVTAAVNSYLFTSISETFVTITGGTILGTTTNDEQVFNNSTTGASPPVTNTGFPIGFSFTYNGVVYDKFAVSTNGWIVLGTGSFQIGGSSGNMTPISTAGPAGFVSAISPLGMDLQGQTSSELSYLMQGAAPNRVLIVQWKGYRYYNQTGDAFTFQIRLYETTNEVRFAYGPFTKNGTARTPQVGIRGATNADYHNRTTTTSWTATTQGGVNTATCTLSSTVLPPSGLTFIFTPFIGVPNCAGIVSPADLIGNVLISATLNWSAPVGGGSPTGYKLYFGTDMPPTNIVNGVNLGLVTTYDPVPDMSYMTTYHWKIVPTNAQGDAAGCPTWTFTTGPDPTIIVFPACESFDGTTFAPYGWVNQKTAGTGTPGTWDRQTTGTNPSCPPHSGAAMARYNCYNLASGTTGILVTPPINFPTDLYRVDFWMYRDSGYPTYSNEVVNIYYNTSPSATGGTLLGTVHRYYGFAPTESTANQWYEYFYDLPPGSGGPGRYIIFEAVSQDGNNIFIDDVCLLEQPLCPAPTYLTATNITSNSADIGWTSTGTNWDVEYGAVPYTFTGTPTFSTTLNPHPLNGLAANTSYTFKVRNNCGGIPSTWTGPYTFTTLCDAVALPYTQNFDGVTAPAIPPCMSVTNNNGDAYTWQTYISNPHSSPNSMSIRYNSTMAMNDWFFTPGFNLTAGTTYQVKFYYRAESTGFPEKLEVLWGTAPSASGMTGGSVWSNTSITNTTYAMASGIFTPATSGVCYLGWHGFSDIDMYRLYVDDIQISAATCINPGIDKYMVSEATIGFGTDYPDIPAGFFGPGSDPFEGQVYLQGHLSNGGQDPYSDVSVQRVTGGCFGDPPSVQTFETEMTQLSLVSTAPIRVTKGGGAVQSFFDVYLEFHTPGPGGTLEATLLDQYGGTFTMSLSYSPIMTFVNTDGSGEMYTYDPESMGYPALQYSLMTPSTWTLSPLYGEFDPDSEDGLIMTTPSGTCMSMSPFLERPDNNFQVTMNEEGVAESWTGNGFNLGAWYFYPNTNWWNVWWYDHRMKIDRTKYIFYPVMTVYPRNVALPSTVEIVYTYSTPDWPAWTINPRPPLPSDVPTPALEAQMIQRSAPLFQFNGSITNPISVPLINPYIIYPYNPEWLSIDIRGYNYILGGMLNHVCFRKVTKSVDFGDAPAVYPTLLASNGARHTIVTGVYLGLLIDGEADGQPIPAALGDDNNNLDDEDGVTFTSALIPGLAATVTVRSSIANALLQAWIDFNADGDWADAGEQIYVNKVLAAGNNLLNFNVPAAAVAGITYARFRMSTQPNLTYLGLAPNGEVEDYQVVIDAIPELDFGDAPAPYPTLLANNGARHTITGLKLGVNLDIEPDGIPDPSAMGDDNTNLDDEDGLWWPCNFTPGHRTKFTVTASGAGFLNAWFDFNADGDWADVGEQIFTNTAILPGTNYLSLTVPVGATIGSTFVRFRFSSQQNLSYTGLAPDGEVEDYQVFIEPNFDRDYGDLPDPTYPTMAASDGARHAQGPPAGVFMGAIVDYELDGQPNPFAAGDVPDEDGVIFLTPLIPGGASSVQITVSMLGPLLQGWIDYNNDGDFGEANEQILVNVNPTALVANYLVNVPAGALIGKTYARFRFSTMPNLSFDGCATNGEVEDYMVYIGQYDLGDAPDPNYPTLLASDGAIHKLSTLYLGVNIDAEPNGQPDATATGDDNNPVGLDDEDGVWWPCNFVTGYKHAIKATTTGQGYLNAWIDYNIDGDWSDQGEQVFTNVLLAAGTNELSLTVPTTASAGNTVARFRFSSQQNLSYTGYAPDGEVEDYSLMIQGHGNYDLGDAPDPTYPTLGASDGARHYNDPAVPIYLGNLIDWEMDGQPTLAANGDDNNNLPDEDGIVFNTQLKQGLQAQITVTASMGGGAFQGWIDFNADGDWSDAGEQVFTNVNLAAGAQPLNFIVPANATLGNTYARFRYSTMGNLSYYGCAPNGEVEDYMVTIVTPEPDRDFGDAPSPYPTLLANNGARHTNTGLKMGPLIDVEPNGLPDPAALGDDNNNSDDEDGVWWPFNFVPGQGNTIRVTASAPGYLNAWMDFNKNGSWAEANEQIFTNVLLAAGVNDLSMFVPAAAITGNTFARFRFSSQQNLSYTGLANDGEVEDFQVVIQNAQDMDYGDAPDSYQTLAASNGARHDNIGPNVFMGITRDLEMNGQPNVTASGDDFNPAAGPDDEDGVVFTTPLVPGIGATVIIKVNLTGGFQQGWIDFNSDGDFTDAGEQIIASIMPSGLITGYAFTVPAGVPLGMTYARFRYSTMPNVPSFGPAPNGEVEDYVVYIGQYDLGDAPDPKYPTTLAANGAIHKTTILSLGWLMDAEVDGQPNSLATGDDINGGPDDEDGVWWPCNLIATHENTIKVKTTGQGYLNAWIDYNGDGDWADNGEQIFTNVLLPAGTTDLFVTVPGTAIIDTTFARFRFSSQQNLSYTGYAPDGEVEDYYIIIESPEEMDYGDAPDPTYPTLSASNGARHYLDPAIPFFLGNLVDGEIDGQPSPLAKGDDLNNLADEDGIKFLTPWIPGQVATIAVTASQGGGAFQAWADFNADGDWSDLGEQIFTNIVLGAGVQQLNFPVPATAQVGNTFARFRYSTMGNLSYYGCAPNGEVEDYQVAIVPAAAGNRAAWHLDENSGNMAYDATIFHNDGVITGATWTTGYSGSALSFDGSGDYVTVPGSASLNITGPFSVSAWIKASGSYWYHGIVDKLEHIGTLSYGFTLYINDNGRLRLSVYSGANGDGDVFGSTDLMDNNYHFVFGSWDGSFLRVYVDGVMEGQVPWAFPPASSSLDVGIGMRLSGWGDSMPFTGIIDEVNISTDPTYEIDFGDAPDPTYPTLGVNNGARHKVSQLYLGASVDAEVNGLPHPSALGDDNSGIDDEDGLIMPPFMITGLASTITVTASQAGILQGWIDYNRDGDWNDAGEQVFTNLLLPAGVSNPTINVPAGAGLGKTYARFRLSSMQNLGPAGYATDGEVEDYIVYILNPGDEKMHWAQYPDLEPTGMDVDLTWVPTADDWMCTETGPVNKIRVWVSFADDILPDPLNSDWVSLKIYSDIQAGINQEWSMPGDLLWNNTFTSGQYTAKLVSTDSPEWWYDPATQIWQPNNHQKVVRFDFDLSTFPFNQEIGTIYWLEMKNVTQGSLTNTLGWKTSKYALRFNDDAVWWNPPANPNPNFPPGWVAHVYPGEPIPHPWAGQSFDMAFRLNPPPDPDLYDFGDAPDPSYPTLNASNGAKHLVDGVTFLGNSVDTELDGQPVPAGMGDDNNGVDDEDGVSFDWPLVTGNPVKMTVVASINTGFLNGWIDFNADGDWSDAGEQVFTNVSLKVGPNTLHFFVPVGAAIGTTYSRFRFSTQANLSYNGAAPDGEVEDYQVAIESNPDQKWFQLPDVSLPGLHASDINLPPYQTIILADDWMCNGGMVTDIHWWGNYETAAGGIEQRGSGINYFHLSIHQQTGAACLPTDPAVWQMNVPFTSLIEQNTGLINNEGSAIYLYEYNLTAPFDQVSGNKYWLDITAIANNPNIPVHWRWQEAMRSYAPIYCGAASMNYPTPGTWSTIVWNNFTPPKFSDMAFVITSGQVINHDWGDLPDPLYPTLAVNNGPSHIMGTLYLGNLIDGELDGKPHPSALGDDIDNLADEDGIVLPPFMTPGQVVTAIVTASQGNGVLQGWIDLNHDGDFNDAGEQIILNQAVLAGSSNVTFTINPAATLGATFARFRLSTVQNLGYTGAAPDGEVEDYKVYIVDPQGTKMHYPQPPDLEPTGMDVDLFWTPTADDFMCTETGPVTHIRTWMSFADDIIPTPLNLDTLMLIIHSDVPAGIEQSWSMPGDILYSHVYFAGQYSAVEVYNDKPEWWYDPATQWWQSNNHTHVFRFDFNLPLNGFTQVAGTVYWLEIRWLKTYPFPPAPPDPYANTLGWKTTTLNTRFNDDAVWWNTNNPNFPTGWVAHTYPGNPYPHPYEGQSFDMAFMINPPPDQDIYDFGDAPDPAYPTLLANDGARHVADGITYLGTVIDTEPDGQPVPPAMGDDITGVPDDEDGVNFLWPLIPGSPCKISVIASVGDALLNLWIDYNHNGSWGDAGEHVFTDLNPIAGINFLTFIVPVNALSGPTYARFRFSHQPALSYTGAAFDGEVEDYMVTIDEYGAIKWQQLPDQSWPGLHSDLTVAIADDWVCSGGEVTDIHWWGNYELDQAGQEERGMGINHFLITIYANANCLPGQILQTYVIPFASVAEVNTGMTNNENCTIYYYEVMLSQPFVQLQGTRYWLSIQAMPNNPNPPLNAEWRWQEANRWFYPIGCGAASMVPSSPWMTVFWNFPQPGQYSDMAFVITSSVNRTLDLKLYLEGLYSGPGTMNKAQDEFGDHFSGTVADQITVELHYMTYPYDLAYSYGNTDLNTNGMASVAIGPGFIEDSYYIAIRHRNSIETWSASPVSFSGSSISYDFTLAASQAYGNNQKPEGTEFVIYGADVNQDGIVDGADMSAVYNASQPPALMGYNPEDTNGDGIVDGADMSMVYNNSQPPPVQVQKP